jgi:hypothetical protein
VLYYLPINAYVSQGTSFYAGGSASLKKTTVNKNLHQLQVRGQGNIFEIDILCDLPSILLFFLPVYLALNKYSVICSSILIKGGTRISLNCFRFYGPMSEWVNE